MKFYYTLVLVKTYLYCNLYNYNTRNYLLTVTFFQLLMIILGIFFKWWQIDLNNSYLFLRIFRKSITNVYKILILIFKTNVFKDYTDHNIGIVTIYID